MVCSVPFLLLFIRVLYSCLLIKVVVVVKVKSDAWFCSPVTPVYPYLRGCCFRLLKVSFAQARYKILSPSSVCATGTHRCSETHRETIYRWIQGKQYCGRHSLFQELACDGRSDTCDQIPSISPFISRLSTPFKPLQI
jgi:hypothetical protein